MTNWRYTCDIKQHLYAFGDGEDDRDNFVATQDAIVAELKKAPDYKTSGEFIGLVLLLAVAADKDEFNETLDQIYDYADEHLIWMGL